MLNVSFKWSYNQTTPFDNRIKFGAEFCKAHYLAYFQLIPIVYNSG
jgi:hypothetical protein